MRVSLPKLPLQPIEANSEWGQVVKELYSLVKVRKLESELQGIYILVALSITART